MGRGAGVGRGMRRAVAGAALLGAVTTLAACSRPTPDEGAVAAALGRLPGVRAVDASFTAGSLGSSGDQDLDVTLAPGTPPEQVEDLVDGIRRAVDEVEHGDEYEQFALVDESEREDAARPVVSSFSWGRDRVEPGLAERWAAAVATEPPGGLIVRSWADERPVSVSMASHEPVSASLAWALGSGLADRAWSVAEYQTSRRPYARFAPDGPLTAAMVGHWRTIEATYADPDADGVVSRVVVVEDHDGVRDVRVSVVVPGVVGPLTPEEHGGLVWPTVDATDATRPAGAGFDLELHRDDDPQGDLVRSGRGDAAWESAYRERFGAAVSAPPA